MTHYEALKELSDFSSLVTYLRDELEWEIPEDLPLGDLTYSYTADELGLKLNAQVEITQLRPIVGRENAWGVFFVDFDKAELPVTLLRRILSSVSRRKRASANAGDRALFDKNDLLFVSAFGKAEDRRLALAHFHQEPDVNSLPTLRVLSWDQLDTPRHMTTVAERLRRLRWPYGHEQDEVWKARWANAFVDRPREAIRTAKEMAQALADNAKQIRVAIQEILPKEKPGQPLTQLFEAVKSTLNKDLDVPKFADTYAQTIAYGLLSKRIDQVQRWRVDKARNLNSDLPLPPITTDALETAIPTNPFLSELLTSFMGAVGRDAGGSALDFDELGLGDLVDLLNTANMEAVLDDFDKAKQGDDPVIHFYEGFLAAYDKAMKVQRGVFYTPRPVVSFIVRSVDEVLRTEFSLPLGLADTTTWGEFVAAHPNAKIPDGVKLDEPFVKILDPATGTGTFLVEVIDLIWRRMTEEVWKGKPAEEKRRLWNAYVAEQLLPRLYGYELMMAPYAVAHMKIGLKLADTGYDFSGVEAGPDGEAQPIRARVFLTNALEPAQDFNLQLAFMNEALAHEAKAANDAKARARFTVVVGNPPYAIKSWNNKPWINRLVEVYKTTVRDEESQIQALSNDYIKFMRLAEHVIGRSIFGVIGLITGHGFTHGTQARDMRHSLLQSFSKSDYLDLHGSIRRGKAGADLDQPIFEITAGVAITVAARSVLNDTESVARLHDLTGTYEAKMDALAKRTLRRYSARSYHTTTAPNFWFRESGNVEEEDAYQSFAPLTAWLGTGDRQADMEVRWATGFTSQQDDLAIAFDPADLDLKLDALATSSSFDELRKSLRVCTTNQWNYDRAKKYVSEPSNRRTTEVSYRPFDPRLTILNRNVVTIVRDRITSQMNGGKNLALLFPRAVTDPKWAHAFIANAPSDKIFLSNKTSTNSYVAPLWIFADGLGVGGQVNLASGMLTRLAKLTDLSFDDGFVEPARGTLQGGESSPSTQSSPPLRRERGDLKMTFGARDVFDWIYTVLHSPAYRERYADFLKSDFVHVPLPKDRGLFATLIPLGTKLVALHLLDADALPDLLKDPRVRFVSNDGEARLGRFNKEVRREPSGRVYLNDQNWFTTVRAMREIG